MIGTIITLAVLGLIVWRGRRGVAARRRLSPEEARRRVMPLEDASVEELEVYEHEGQLYAEIGGYDIPLQERRATRDV